MHGEDVLDDDDGVEEEEGLHPEDVSQDQVEIADPCRIGSDEVSEDRRNLDQNVPEKSLKHARRKQLVDQRSEMVKSFLFVASSHLGKLAFLIHVIVKR